ncbi:calcineurin-like phosphoesterase C-terminal domain-containing protein [Cognatilysobacter terrigena]|uniref:calcineurin-like phosphoesterase C-terminal domain-containing protein n=1 Tax=Cognatilysobacter terrigena TaxID=2488749 RepID=UPI00105EA748|nr:calcineurin-like phosphoesterase family protein [Lysobacter terrigena]
MTRTILALALLVSAASAHAQTPATCDSAVYEDRNGNGRRDGNEPGIAGVRVSDGVRIVTSADDGRFALPAETGRTLFVIKPAGYDAPRRADGLPLFWAHAPHPESPALRYGGLRDAGTRCPSFGLRRTPRRDADLDVLVFADTQTKSQVDVGYYARDIVEPLRRRDGKPAADLGVTLGDVTSDDLSLYPAITEVTTRLGAPWLHVAGNHDVDTDATRDEDALLTFRQQFGPDTYAWEEPRADFVVLDDVISRPGQKPAYVGGLRDDQFAFLQQYIPTHDPKRLLVIAVHIPLFPDGGETFRTADRERLFALLKDVPHVLVLSGHGHVQRQFFHDAATGWHGASPLHEYNAGAACGAYWSGVKNAEGVPDSTMPDGTPNGTARLAVGRDGAYKLAWQRAGVTAQSGELTRAMHLHAPRVLRHGAYPAWGVYANVWMGTPQQRTEFRVDGGDWMPMKRVEQPDPWLLAENVRDDEATALRGYDRSPEAQPSTHLWRGALPTSLAVGEHRVEVRTFDRWQGEQHANTTYRLDDAAP